MHNQLHKIFFLITLIPLLLIACGDHVMQVSRLEWQLNLKNDLDTGKKYETLSLFLQLDKDSNLADLESIYLIHESNRFFWELNMGNWDSKKIGQLTWVGSNNIRFPQAEGIPRKSYRIIIRDLGGEESERSLFISTPQGILEQAVFPSIDLANKTYRNQEQTIIFVYNSEYEDINYKALPGNPSSSRVEAVLNEILGQENATYISLYYFKDNWGCGIISGPYKLIKP